MVGSPLLGLLRTSQFKFIDAPRPELYDLKNDPRESADVQNKYPPGWTSILRKT